MKGSNQRIGTYASSSFAGETVRAYVPAPLPPQPPVRLDAVQVLLEQANHALGRLDGLASALPDISLFIYAYVRKEAVLSSQIEGTQSSLSDLLLFENDQAPGMPVHDVQDVSNYVAALNHGMRRLRGGFPLSLRLIREIHKELLSKGRGSGKEPGEFRHTQNWIGGTRSGNSAFVPPPPGLVMECMSKLELFIHDDKKDMPLLIKAALVHVQFETIHPFLDGNGRLGRLLVTFLLCEAFALQEPILYLSLFFKKHRQLYYDLLNRVRLKGDWEAWIEFFLSGVKETSEEAVSSARRILKLLETDRKKIERLGRPAASALKLHQFAQTNPILAIAATATKLGISFPTVSAAVEHLQRLGILEEITNRQRSRLFVYREYLDIWSEGTAPLA